MSTSPIIISNRSLAQAGTRVQISNFNEGSVEAINCNLLYQPTFEALGRSAHWNCLASPATPLTLLKAAQGTPENQTGTTLPIPPQPWLYEYLLPSDCLMVRYLQPIYTQPAGQVPLFPTPSSVPRNVYVRREINFTVATDLDAQGNRQKVILTNLSQALIVYTVNEPNPEFWDSQFQAAYVASLAAFLIPPLNLNMALLNMQTKIADGIIMTARATDGNEGVVSQNRDASWIVARGCGSEINTGYYSGWNCENMNWPGG
jgi:hypothetical protein